MDKLERELLQEWVLKRAVGGEALSVGSSMSSADPKTMRVDSLAVAEAGAIVDLELPAPGRIRLLSGGHGNLQPWYNDGSHGQQWSRENDTVCTTPFILLSIIFLIARKDLPSVPPCSLDVLAGYKMGGHTTGKISLNGLPKTDSVWRRVAGYCK